MIRCQLHAALLDVEEIPTTYKSRKAFKQQCEEVYSRLYQPGVDEEELARDIVQSRLNPASQVTTITSCHAWTKSTMIAQLSK